MGPLDTWAKLLIGVIAVLVLLWFFPGVKSMIVESRDAKKDWPDATADLGNEDNGRLSGYCCDPGYP